MNASLRLPTWFLIVERLLCLVVLVFVILIWREMKDPESKCADPESLACECPQLPPDPGAPSGSPIQPEPDTVVIRGRVAKNSGYVNGVAIKLEESISGDWKLRRTTATHYSQYDGSNNPSEVGWYAFVITTLTGADRDFRVCAINDNSTCETVTVATTSVGTLSMPDIDVTP